MNIFRFFGTIWAILSHFVIQISSKTSIFYLKKPGFPCKKTRVSGFENNAKNPGFGFRVNPGQEPYPLCCCSPSLVWEVWDSKKLRVLVVQRIHHCRSLFKQILIGSYCFFSADLRGLLASTFLHHVERSRGKWKQIRKAASACTTLPDVFDKYWIRRSHFLDTINSLDPSLFKVQNPVDGVDIKSFCYFFLSKEKTLEGKKALKLCLLLMFSLGWGPKKTLEF